jgi:hypothetical protein
MRIFLTLMFLSLTVQSYAGTDGHGGGSICIGSRCMTLAEAGFRIATQSTSPVEISPDVIAELKLIDSELPSFLFSSFLGNYKLLDISKIIGEPGEIRFIASANPKLVDKFFKEYTRILIDNNAQQLIKDFSVAGFTDTSERITYIILDRYNKLSTARSKALLLIHEYSLRSLRRDLKEALRFDGAIVDYLNAREKNHYENFNAIDFLKTTLPKQAYGGYIWGDILHRTGPLPVQEIFTSYSRRGEFATVSLDYMKILEDRKYEPHISSYIEPGDYSFQYISRDDIINDYIRAVADNQKTIVFTSKNFEEFLSKYLLQNPNLKSVVQELNNCPNKITEKSIKIMSVPLPPVFNVPVLADCGGYYSESGMAPLWSYIKGMVLTIPGKLVCSAATQVCHLEK